MKWSDSTQVQLGPDELDLLASNISNEVVNGFKVHDFQSRIGVSEEEFKAISKRLRSESAPEYVSMSAHKAHAFRNALALTLEELGVEDFQTRTGHDFDHGSLILREFDRILSESE